MTIQRLENVGIVVEDLAAATTFFVELGLKVLGEGPVAGGWVDRVVGLEGVRVDIAMLETSDGHGRLELMKFHARRLGAATATRRRTPSGSAVSPLPSMTSTPPSPGCKPAAWSCLVRWSATKTVTSSAMSAARRGSSSCLPSSLAEGSGRSPPRHRLVRHWALRLPRQPAGHDSPVCATRFVRRNARQSGRWPTRDWCVPHEVSDYAEASCDVRGDVGAVVETVGFEAAWVREHPPLPSNPGHSESCLRLPLQGSLQVPEQEVS